MSALPWAGGSTRKRRRAFLRKRDGDACNWCGTAMEFDPLFADTQEYATVDHLVPLEDGGSTSDPANMVLACRFCNETRTKRDYAVQFATLRFLLERGLTHASATGAISLVWQYKRLRKMLWALARGAEPKDYTFRGVSYRQLRAKGFSDANAVIVLAYLRKE